MSNIIKIAGIVGSIYHDSVNRKLIKKAVDVCPRDKAEISIIEIDEIPIFNRGKDEPKVVTEIKEKIKSADAVLIATPEYNYSIPGALKNAIDWLSYPQENNCFEKKPIAIMSGSSGIFGGLRAQLNLRQIFITLNGLVLPKPEVMISSIFEKISDGKIADTETIEKIEALLDSLIEWTNKLEK